MYAFAVPDSPAARYLFVNGADTVGVDNFGDVARLRDGVVWVTSVSRNASAPAAADEAAWGSEKAQAALLNWRPTTGDIAWRPVHLDGQPVQRDNDLPDTVMFVVDRYGITHQ